MIKIIFAMGARGEFGYKNQLPWGHCAEDMKHFYEYTKGCSLVMGRNTYDSLPADGLVGRELVVLTRDEDFEPAKPDSFEFYNLKSFTNMLKACQRSARNETLIVIGGPSLIMEALEVADEVSMSIIYNSHGPFDHDVRIDTSELNLKLLLNFERIEQKDIGERCSNEIWRRIENV